MKKLLVMAAMVLSSVGAFAQYSAGDITIQPKIGLNVASVGVDALQQGAGLLACQGQLVILLLLVAALDAEGDVVAVLLPFTPRVEDLDHCHIAVDGEAALASLREAVLVVDDIAPSRLPRIHSLRLEVAEP